MKEEEAKTKWCPQGGLEVGLQMIHYAIITNGNLKAHKESIGELIEKNRHKCIASGCACWKWDISPEKSRKYKAECNTYNPEPSGHCGLTK